MPAGDGTRGPGQAVEDQVKADLELVAVAVAGLQDMLQGQLGEAWVLPSGQLAEDVPRDLAGPLTAGKGQPRLLQREP
jgi:hypothetical protein